MNTLTVCALGPTPYGEGVALQEGLVAARAEGRTGDWLLYPDHPRVLTVGRNPSQGNLRLDRAALASRGLEVFEVPRGGDITWHGPGQLVGYPVVQLDRVDRDLHRWLRMLEEAMIRVLVRHGLTGLRSPGRTGVWLSEERKIASIGVAVRRWVGYHGFALNIAPDLSDFEQCIHPCGLHGIRMTSMAEALGSGAPSLAQVREEVTAELVALLGYTDLKVASGDTAREVAGIAADSITSRPQNPAGSGPLSQGVNPW
ncbi:MAG: lipoyl(octanoyl) transferase LipB [Candidatus Eisenbacteria bacterium]